MLNYKHYSIIDSNKPFFSMQKDMIRIMDEELGKNNLSRISDPFMKSENSFFRALSMALFYTHSEWQKIQSYMKLCGICVSQLSTSQNPFPLIPSRSKYLIKFHEWKMGAKDYFNNPDLQCFQKENLQMASVLFDCQVEMYTLNGSNDQFYLQSIIINLGNESSSIFLRQKLKPKKYIRLAKLSNRYYCVLTKQKTRIISFVKQFLIHSITNLNSNNQINSNQTNKIQHYPNYQEQHAHNHHRQHKKSLSDCGDLAAFNEQIIKVNPKRYGLDCGSSDNGAHFQLNSSANLGKNPQNKTNFIQNIPSNEVNQMLEVQLQTKILLNNKISIQQPFIQEQIVNQFNLHNQHYNHINPYLHYHYEYTSPIPSLSHSHSHTQPLQQKMPYALYNNYRYQGRLKFFDPNKNYGFIVVDDINQDLFVHLDDLSKAGITKQSLKNNISMRFQFTCLQYDGKHKKSKKAVDLILLPNY